MRRGIFIGLAGLAFLIFASSIEAPLSAGANGAKKVRWYRVLLESGETSSGYRWTVGAKGPKHEPLREICSMTGMTEPPQPDKPYIESHEGELCGLLLLPEESMTISASFGFGESRVTVFASIYRPIVRKVTIVLDSGERRIYLPKVPQIPNRAERGIPVFRYIADVFEGEFCARRTTTFDGQGDVIHNDINGGCPAGEPAISLKP
jgi:hypothetical protein